MTEGRKAPLRAIYGCGGDPIDDDLADEWCADYHCAGDCGMPHNGIEAVEYSLAYRAEKAESQLRRLLFDLWRDGVLSEQQCATYLDADLVYARGVLDIQAQNNGFRDRMEVTPNE